MRISTFFYTLKQGVINIFRNKLFSLASIATISACLFLFGLFYAVILNFQNVVRTAEEGVSVTVFFKDGTTQEEMEQIGAQIQPGRLLKLIQTIYQRISVDKQLTARFRYV